MADAEAARGLRAGPQALGGVVDDRAQPGRDGGRLGPLSPGRLWRPVPLPQGERATRMLSLLPSPLVGEGPAPNGARERGKARSASPASPPAPSPWSRAPRSARTP